MNVAILSFLATAFMGAQESAGERDTMADEQKIYMKIKNFEKWEPYFFQVAESLECSTSVGKTLLFKLMCHPGGSELETVERRQRIIRALVDHPSLKAEFEQLLAAAAQIEHDLRAFFDYFTDHPCIELEQIKAIEKNVPRLLPLTKKIVFNPAWRTLNMLLNGAVVSITGGYVLWLGSWLYKHGKQMPLQEQLATGLYGCLGGAIAGIVCYLMYQDYLDAADKRMQLHNFNQFITIAERLEQLCAEYGIEQEFTLTDCGMSETRALVDDLKQSCYAKKERIFFMPPVVDAFFAKIYANIEHLMPVFGCIAELDVYNAFATQLIQSKVPERRWCFTTFVKQEQPYIDAHLFWDPVLLTSEVDSIHASMPIGSHTESNKLYSSYALFINILLSQTFGVAAAHEFTLKPLDMIKMYD